METHLEIKFQVLSMVHKMVIKWPWSSINLVNNENVNVMVAHVMVMAIWWMMMLVMMKIMGIDQTMTVPHGKPHIGSVSRLSNASRWVGARVVYHVFSMSLRLFFVFRNGVQRHMGVPYTGVRPCMAVPTRNYTLEVFCTFQMDLYTQKFVCPKGCLPYV